jgi:hypothetical protein
MGERHREAMKQMREGHKGQLARCRAEIAALEKEHAKEGPREEKKGEKKEEKKKEENKEQKPPKPLKEGGR